MKELLLPYSAYNVWANQQVLDAILLLTDEQQRRTIVSSFDSVRRTVLHLWDAESIWWQRVKLQERIVRPSEGFEGDMNELARQLLAQSRTWHEWVAGAGEHQVQHVFQYRDSKREAFKQPVAQVLLHMFNHSTYHRGQLVTMLRQLGVVKVPGTDFIAWCRRKG